MSELLTVSGAVHVWLRGADRNRAAMTLRSLRTDLTDRYRDVVEAAFAEPDAFKAYDPKLVKEAKAWALGFAPEAAAPPAPKAETKPAPAPAPAPPKVETKPAEPKVEAKPAPATPPPAAAPEPKS